MDSNRDVARRVYNTPEGRTLLTDLLNDFKFFDVCENEHDMILNNEAKRLLYKLGIWREHNILRIVNALMNMPYAEEGDKE